VAASFLRLALPLLLVSCDAPSATGAASTAALSAASAASSGAAPDPSVGRAVDDRTALAMADPGTNTTVDAQVRAAQEWVRRLPKSTDKMIELGRAWAVKARHSSDPGHYLHVKACAELVLDREADNHLARELLALVFASQHRFNEARELAERVLERDPEAFITLGVLSDVAFELGRMEQAIEAADRMAAFKPNAASYVRVSFFLWLRGKGPQALSAAKLAIEAAEDPANPEPKAYALSQTAGFFFHRGDYEGADAGYDKALAAFPGYPPALAGRGRVAHALGDAKRAVALLEASFRAAPLAETAWRLGDARAAAGDERGAAEVYARVVEIGRAGDRRTLALFYAVKNRDVDEAVRLAAAEMKERPGMYTEDAYGWALYRAGRPADAKQHSEAAIRHGTPDASLLYHAGAVRLALGDRSGEKLVRDALTLSPQFDPTAAPEARRLLDGLR
jgi:tetratricopeptide (TPR) repeat protein